MRKRSWTVNELKNAVSKSRSYAQVLRNLNLKEAGGNYMQVRKYIRENKLGVEHFKGQGWSRGMRGIGKPVIPLERILVKNFYFQSSYLKQRLFNVGLKKRECEKCRWAERTPEGYLPLELDHVNGNHYDNRLENLRVLCPNCHSLTPFHRGRKGSPKY